MKCILSWCHSKSEKGPRPLCHEHFESWVTSLESVRYVAVDALPHRETVFHDWIRRLEAERLNHGNGVANG